MLANIQALIRIGQKQLMYDLRLIILAMFTK